MEPTDSSGPGRGPVHAARGASGSTTEILTIRRVPRRHRYLGLGRILGRRAVWLRRHSATALSQAPASGIQCSSSRPSGPIGAVQETKKNKTDSDNKTAHRMGACGIHILVV